MPTHSSARTLTQTALNTARFNSHFQSTCTLSLLLSLGLMVGCGDDDDEKTDISISTPAQATPEPPSEADVEEGAWQIIYRSRTLGDACGNKNFDVVRISANGAYRYEPCVGEIQSGTLPPETLQSLQTGVNDVVLGDLKSPLECGPAIPEDFTDMELVLPDRPYVVFTQNLEESGACYRGDADKVAELRNDVYEIYVDLQVVAQLN